eukprot:434309-Pyramimonas_sp.AAC.1
MHGEWTSKRWRGAFSPRLGPGTLTDRSGSENDVERWGLGLRSRLFATLQLFPTSDLRGRP